MQGFIGQKTIPCFRIAFLEHIFLSLSQWYPSRVRRMSVTFSHSSTNATTPLSFVFVSFSMWQAGEWSPAGCVRHFAVDNRTSFLYNIMCNCQGEVFSEFLSSNFLSNFPNTLWIQEPLHKLSGSGQLSVASGKFRWNIRARRPVLWYWPGNEPSALRIHDTNRASENPPGGSKVFSGNWNWAES